MSSSDSEKERPGAGRTTSSARTPVTERRASAPPGRMAPALTRAHADRPSIDEDPYADVPCTD
jgi:hypothetical protein